MTATTETTTSRVSSTQAAKTNHNFVFGSWLLPNAVIWIAAIVMAVLIANSATGQVAGFTSNSLFTAVALFGVISVIVPLIVTSLLSTSDETTTEVVDGQSQS